MSVRVRYAPSPTGLQHIGSLRTALFNYFYARSHGGQCILRIEDTDRTRFDPRALDDMYETFRWMDLDFDEGPEQGGDYGPYVQSERSDVYRDHARRLMDEGRAYTCFCSAERLEILREQQQHDGGVQGYDGRCRSLSSSEAEQREAAGEPFVIRFRLPEGAGVLHVEDGVLGTVKRACKDISPDPVLLKSDGLPTYHLASVVDDHLMNISHVIRAQEWLSSAALHCLLYEALGWKPPKFLHLPMVLGKDGKKLSKRHGSTSIAEFRREGYLPEALLNHVITLGWSLGEGEFFTREELKRVFAEGSIHKAPAVFDYRKLQWYNASYIRQADDERLVSLCRPYLEAAGLLAKEGTQPQKEELLLRVMPLAKQRMRILSGIPDVIGFLYTDLVLESADTILQKNQTREEALEALAAVRADFDSIAALDDEAFHAWFEKRAEELNCGLGRVMMPLRMALTGSKASPPLSDCIRLMGKETALRRLEQAIRLLEKA